MAWLFPACWRGVLASALESSSARVPAGREALIGAGTRLSAEQNHVQVVELAITLGTLDRLVPGLRIVMALSLGALLTSMADWQSAFSAPPSAGACPPNPAAGLSPGAGPHHDAWRGAAAVI